MERALAEINALKESGQIVSYAIGGAVGASFYMEPIETIDLDVFVVLPPSNQIILTLTGVYDFLRARGHNPVGEHVSIHGILVQFLATDALTQEALERALDQTVGTVATRVMRPEHLAAIMLRLGRPKDRLRIEMMLREAQLDRALLDDILQRHGLQERWQALMRVLYGDRQ